VFGVGLTNRYPAVAERCLFQLSSLTDLPDLVETHNRTAS
jgi:hypothetical protein